MEIIFKYMTDSQPSWFDWLSLAVMIGSILCAYYFGEKNYKREKKDKEKEDLENIKSEKDLFDNNLYMLKYEIEEQIKDLKKYVDKKGFRIKVNPKIQIDFLHFVSIKSLYKNNDRNKVNNLLSTLYGLSHFYDLLKREIGDCNAYYSKEEKIFISNYQEVFYIQIDILSNKHLGEKDEYGNLIGGELNTSFMNEYKGITETFNDYVYVGNSVENSRVVDKLNEIMKITGKYIPYNIDATTINTYANKAYFAYLNMENRRNQHFEVIATFIEILEDTNKEIERYSRK